MTRTYAQDFVVDALRLVEQEHGMYKRVAKRLGIPDSTLRGWYNKHMGKTRSGPRPLKEYAALGEETSEEKLIRLERENRDLKKRLADAETDKAILKKAAAFFARESE
jgi:transposase